MVLCQTLLQYARWSRSISRPCTLLRRRFSALEEPGPAEVAELGDVEDVRSPPAKGLAALRINEGGNINRADLIGTVTELKLLARLSKPDSEWATVFLRTRIPILSTNDALDADCTKVPDESAMVTHLPFRMVNYHNRVHVFDRRLLPLVRRTKPGDRIFVTGFVSYYKPTLSASSPEVAQGRKIGAVVAERLILLGPSNEPLSTASVQQEAGIVEVTAEDVL
ncbi:unnamed protein product [Schistocephalus solidus]|uniref:AA_TRNA_LIGASE_II domain-containing protein n=1 Tax=Schistocephalus solidus TaxID=70667 RepID=A0A0V0J206_SCHSO|nr:unnamed protein product [Schistocephalus solidus]